MSHYSYEIDRRVDCIGLSCPMPVVKTRIELEKMKKGEILLVVADDPGSKQDIPSWCNISGHEFLGMEEKEGRFYYYIKKIN